MTISRKVARIIQPQFVIEGEGVLLRRSFGPDRANRFDPFLLFDHFAFNDPAEAPVFGFPTHPHRGIETVTYMLEGSVRHRDSLGNIAMINPGDIQWMTAGRGILHEEMPQPSPKGKIDGFQLWVNLPASMKMCEPRYMEVTTHNIQVVEKDGITARVVAGELMGARGPVEPIAVEPLYADITLQPGAAFRSPIPQGHNAVAYVFEGRGSFGMDETSPGQEVEAVSMAVFGDGDEVHIRASSNSPVRFMRIAGGPVGEPIVPYGPFVMNTVAEIQQTLIELRNGTFIR